MSTASATLSRKRDARVLVDQPRVHVPERIAGFAIVQVHVARHEDRAGLLHAARERDARVVEQPVGAGPHDRVGRAFVALALPVLESPLQRRGLAVGRLILREPRQQRALPRLAPVDGLEQPDPRVGGHLEAAHRIERAGQVDGAIVVGAGEQVQRVAGRDGGVRFVLALQVGIAVRERGPGHHVDVASWRPAAAAAGRTGGRRRRRGGREQAQRRCGSAAQLLVSECIGSWGSTD